VAWPQNRLSSEPGAARQPRPNSRELKRMSEITNWLIVESFANWEVDFANNFSYFGLTARFEKLAKEMTPGDLLFDR
jgi:hypothetical protein